MVFGTGVGNCSCLQNGTESLVVQVVQKRQDSHKIRLLLVENVALNTAAERIEGLFFIMFSLCVECKRF